MGRARQNEGRQTHGQMKEGDRDWEGGCSGSWKKSRDGTFRTTARHGTHPALGVALLRWPHWIVCGAVQDEMVFFWMTPENASSVLQYGLSPEELTETVSADEGHVAQRYEYRRELSKWYHRLHARGLQPNTVYHYRVGDDQYGFSDIRWFKTRSDDPEATVKIATLGDQVRQAARHR